MNLMFTIIILQQNNCNNLDSIFNQDFDDIQVISLNEDNSLIQKYR